MSMKDAVLLHKVSIHVVFMKKSTLTVHIDSLATNSSPHSHIIYHPTATALSYYALQLFH